VITILAVLAYLPAFKLSFIADDFPQIQMSRTIAEPGGLQNLYKQPIAHWRMTFFIVTYFVDRVAGLDPEIYHGVAVALHVLCCWLVYGLCLWKPVDKNLALIAASFFAVFEGHQEAVMWYSAIMESLLFLFGIGAMLCFIEWLEGKGRKYYVLAIVSFSLALFSKESAYIYAVLMLLAIIEAPARKEAILGWLPFCALAAACVIWIALSRGGNPRFNDGSFALTPHFPRVLAESFGRLLFVWGLLALVVIGIYREHLRLTVYALLWMLVALVPYSFLTYLNRVPSRLTYLASAGLSLLVGAALMSVWEHVGGRIVLVLAAMILLTNVGILWRKKADQYQTRALPTDILVNAVRHAQGPIHMRCFPYIPLVAESAAEEFGGMVLFEPDAQKSDGRCLNFWYKDRVGAVREVFVPQSRLP
jgi:hypothetical protein